MLSLHRNQEREAHVKLFRDMIKFSIYQVNRENEHSILFMDLRFFEKIGIKPTMDKYNKVYSGETEEGGTHTILERLFSEFNIHHPADFRGHSLSVSDVVEIDGTFYFCDSYGFKNIINF